MHKKRISALAVAVATCFPLSAHPASEPQGEATQWPALGSGITPLALVAAALAGLALAGGGGSGGGNSGGEPHTGADGSTSAADTVTRAPTYTSAADFRTTEYRAQQGLAMVRADWLYYNGHAQWSRGAVSHPAAGTGIGVKVAVADTGINGVEGATGNAIAIDAAGSYDYTSNQRGSGADDYGHGTHVAGLIAAPKNGAGMHGLAYNATIVNFKIGDWTGLITATDAQLGDMIRRAGNAGAMVINNSWATQAPITAYTSDELQRWRPGMIEAARAHVARGGVVVFAAGNDRTEQNPNAPVSVEAGMPYLVSGLRAGWLAVVAVDASGRLASYSNRCSVAAAWCLAAPGGSQESGLYSMYGSSTYASMFGTSMAAPHAAAALAGLKSMFPNLSYHQLRDRLLRTASKDGAYADQNTYGQGLMNLQAASAPVDGVSVPIAASANGTTAPLAGSGVQFHAGTLRALGMQSTVLVVDNYQRAPFWVAAHAFFREASPRLLDRQWTSLRSAQARDTETHRHALRFSHSPELHSVASAHFAADRAGFSSGAGGEAILGTHLGLARVPQLTASGAESLALGYAAELGRLRIGLLGSLPAAQNAATESVESSSLGQRKALGMVAQQRAGATTYGVTVAFADDFERPIGIATSGAFGVDDSAAVSSGAFVSHAFTNGTVVEGSLEAARHRAEASAALAAPAYAVRSASFGMRMPLDARTAFSASARRDWVGGEAARLQVPTSIAENGDIGRVTYLLPYDELVGRSTFSLRLDHSLTRRIDVRASVIHERRGFGAALAGFAAMVEIRH